MSTALKLRAEAEARASAKAVRSELAKKATREYQAALRAEDEKTARLRALRLAKEANEAPRAEKPERRTVAARKRTGTVKKTSLAE
jgi:hypothetical protein